MRLLLHRSLTIDQTALERVIQAALFYAESVIVRATSTVAGDSEQIYRRLNDLADIGAVTTWAHEYEVSAGGRVTTCGSGRVISRGIPNDVVSLDTTRALVGEVDDELRQNRSSPYAGRHTRLQQGVAEVVQFRHSMLLLRLVDRLGAGGVVTGHRNRSHLLSSVERAVKSADSHEAVVREVVDRCSFGSLADLPLKAIADCRRETARFSVVLDGHINSPAVKQADRVSEIESARELAREILAEYQRVQGRYSKQEAVDTGANAWDVVGAVLPSAVILKLAGARIEWFRHRKHARPFMLLGKLQHYGENS
jgi:hypothetical protein